MCGSNERQPMVDEEELSADENDAKNDKHIESETRTSWSSPSPPPLTPSVTPNSSHPSASRRSSDDLSASLSTLSTRSEHSYVTPSKLTGMAVRPFPRTDWSSVTFADLNAPFWTPKEETEWAGREASRRWAMALESGDLNDLTIADFGVAVFDHVCEFVQSNRKAQSHQGAHGWTLHTNIAIEFSYKAAEWRLREVFSRDPRVGGFFDRGRVYSFVRAALNWQWVGGAHGGGRGGPMDRPQLVPFDRNWIARYLPGYPQPIGRRGSGEMEKEKFGPQRRLSDDWVTIGHCMTRHADQCNCYGVRTTT
ncbi:unnamed protein product [Cutaneotrichosporon oleaginosum]